MGVLTLGFVNHVFLPSLGVIRVGGWDLIKTMVSKPALTLTQPGLDQT